MKIAVYPGTFDPPTNGHLDIIKRASLLFDRIIIAVTDSNTHKNPTFDIDTRLEILKEITKKMNNVTVDSFHGLLVDYVKSVKATVIVRGLRVISDFEFEFQMALMNRKLDKNIETIFLMPDEKFTYLSSSVVKEIVHLGGNMECLIPEIVKEKLLEKYGNKNRDSVKKAR